MERCPSWLKEHAWKACVGHKLTAGSNPALSAIFLGEMPERSIGAVSKIVVRRLADRGFESHSLRHFFISNTIFFIKILDDINFEFYICYL